MLTVIPFSGFYHSIHDEEVDSALESMFQDSSGNANDALTMRAFDCVDWQLAQTAYAKHYAGGFADEFEIEGLTFESLNSPREYNFTTDRIFVNIPRQAWARIIRKTSRDYLEKTAREMFTSRSGFISFYSNDWKAWGAFSTWDHNQRFAMISAYVLTCRDGEEFDQWAEFHLMESARNNGEIENFLSSSATTDIHRLWKVGDYLREREERSYRILRGT